MKLLNSITICLLVAAVQSQACQADIINFRLTGIGGPGITPVSEFAANGMNPITNGGSGGEAPGGIFFDDLTNMLTVNVHWGSGADPMFTDLSSTVSLFNLHGPTASPAPDSFTQSGSALITLGSNNSPTNGGFSGTVQIPQQNVNNLLAGQLYLHIHTNTNGGGEARGYLVAVPEPRGWILLLSIGGVVSAIAYRRRSRLPLSRNRAD